MSPLQHSNNLAARMGRWSARHWKTAVFGWLAFVVAAVAIGQVVGQKTVKQQDTNVGQAHRADTILAQAGFGQSDPQTEIVLIQSKHLTIGDPAFRSTVRDVVGAVSPSKAIKNLRSPLEAAHGDLVSKDRHSALVEWDMKGTEEAAEKRIDVLTKATASRGEGPPGPLRRRGRLRQLEQGPQRDVQQAAGPGGRAVDSAHADHPAARLRNVRRRLDPPPAGADSRDRDHGHRRRREPRHSDGRERQRGGAARRARSRRRLHALLPEARARGAGRGPEPPGRTRGRRGDVRPLGARSPDSP